jgi:hypothetical protein
MLLGREVRAEGRDRGKGKKKGRRDLRIYENRRDDSQQKKKREFLAPMCRRSDKSKNKVPYSLQKKTDG